MDIYYHVRGVGSVLGVSATGAMLDIRESVHSSRLLDLAGRLNPDIHRLQVGLGHALHARGLPATTANLGSYQIFNGLVTKQTLTLAYIDIFWCFQMLALAGIVLVLVLWPNARRAAATVVRPMFVLAFKTGVLLQSRLLNEARSPEWNVFKRNG